VFPEPALRWPQHEEIRMLRIVSLAAIVGISLVNISTAYAGPGKNLAECYDTIIAACNKTAHPQSCADSGFDACDEIHPKPLVIDPKTAGLGLKVVN
jgi:hypothetical protein